MFLWTKYLNVLAILIKHGKSDGTSLSSDFLIYAAPVIADALAQLFTAILQHGYVPASLRDCLIVPIRKGQKDPSISDNYHSIALAPSLSKTLEWVILSQFILNFSALMTCSLALRRVCPLHCALAL